MTTVEDGSGANAEIEKLNKQLAASREQVVSMGAENDWLAARVAELESENEALKLRVQEFEKANADAPKAKSFSSAATSGSLVNKYGRVSADAKTTAPTRTPTPRAQFKERSAAMRTSIIW